MWKEITLSFSAKRQVNSPLVLAECAENVTVVGSVVRVKAQRSVRKENECGREVNIRKERL